MTFSQQEDEVLDAVMRTALDVPRVFLILFGSDDLFINDISRYIVAYESEAHRDALQRSWAHAGLRVGTSSRVHFVNILLRQHNAVSLSMNLRKSDVSLAWLRMLQQHRVFAWARYELGVATSAYALRADSALVDCRETYNDCVGCPASAFGIMMPQLSLNMLHSAYTRGGVVNWEDWRMLETIEKALEGKETTAVTRMLREQLTRLKAALHRVELVHGLGYGRHEPSVPAISAQHVTRYESFKELSVMTLPSFRPVVKEHMLSTLPLSDQRYGAWKLSNTRRTRTDPGDLFGPTLATLAAAHNPTVILAHAFGYNRNKSARRIRHFQEVLNQIGVASVTCDQLSTRYA